MQAVDHRLPVRTRRFLHNYWVTLLALISLGVLAWGFYELHQANVKADRAAKQSAKLSKETAHLAVENSLRISQISATQRDIQESRMRSCRETYKTISDLLAISEAAHNGLTPQQAATFRAMQQRVRPSKCTVQTKVAHPPPGGTGP